MKIKILIILSLLLIGCKSKIQYVPLESVRVEKEIETIHDTIIQVKLVPYYTNVVTPADSSFLENQYAFSRAFWDGKFLHHSLGIKDIQFPVNIQWRDRWHTRYDSIPYPVEVPIKGDTIYKMKWYEEIFFFIGTIVTLLGGIYLLYKYLRRRFFS